METLERRWTIRKIQIRQEILMNQRFAVPRRAWWTMGINTEWVLWSYPYGSVTRTMFKKRNLCTPYWMMNCLQVNGPKTQLSLSTMHAENELVSSQRIKGLVVSDINRNTTIQLPTTSCESIPAKRQQIPCPEMAQPWPHLNSIAHHLVPLQTDVNVGLLIGSNCSQAIMPHEFIPGKPNEPYAQRTDLGWGIIGNVGGAVADEDNVSSGVANHISTESIQFLPLCIQVKRQGGY